MKESDSSTAESLVSKHAPPSGSNLRGWVRVAAVAAASALAGGLAAAWFYRKTLHRLREAESDGSLAETGSPHTETEFDI